MHRKKIIGLSLAALIVVSSPAYAAEPNSITADVKVVPVSAKVPAEEKVDVVVAKEDASVSEFIKIHLKIPKVQGLQDVLYQEKLNASILDRAMKEAEKMEAQAKEAAVEAEKGGWTFRPYELDVSYEVKSKGEILSFTVTTYAYMGGANGMPWMDCYNIDTKQNREIQLQELFREGVDYESLLNQQVFSEIEEQKKKFEDVYYFEGDMGFKTIADRQGYYLQDGKLVLSFSKYSIAPGAAGMPEFKIPLYVLGPALKNSQPLIAEGTYYNYRYNFQFKIPPLWKDKVQVVESYGVNGANMEVDFLYASPEAEPKQQSLGTLSVVNAGDYKGQDASRTYKIAQTEAYVYLVSLPQSNIYKPESEAAKEYAQCKDALDGVDDLFKVVNVRDELETAALNYIKINNNTVALENPIYRLDNRTAMVPLRQVAEALGYSVTWNDEKQMIELSKGVQWTALKIGEDNYSFAKMLINLGTAPELKDSKTYVPLNFVTRVLQAEVMETETGMLSITQ